MTDSEQDPLSDLERDLRWGVGREWRQEAEEVERLTVQGELRRRTLGDVVADLAHRSDRVGVTCDGWSAVGTVVDAGLNYLTLESADRTIDVRADQVAIRLLAPGERTEPWTPAGSRTWKARLAEFEQTAEPVRLWGATLADEIAGTLAVVATDHVVVSDEAGDRSYVPIEAITVVIRPSPPRPHRGPPAE